MIYSKIYHSYSKIYIIIYNTATNESEKQKARNET